MSSQQRVALRKDALYVTAFVAVTGTLIAAIGLIFGNVRIAQDTTYRAVFSDITGLTTNDQVRAAGVDVGRVQSMELRPDSTVLVTFSVAKNVPVTARTTLRIRYANLIGGRYLGLAQPPGRIGLSLPPNSTVPETRTTPALDLDTLFNGFQPVMQGLDPMEINQLSSALIRTFDGEGSDVAQLLRTVAQLTNGLADHDQMIGQLIDNLSVALGTLHEHRAQFGQVIVNTQRVISGLARDQGRIGESLVRLDSVTRSGTRFLATIRPQFRALLPQILRFSAIINAQLPLVDHVISTLPEVLSKVSRVGAYGTFYNMYICGVRVTTTGPSGRPVESPMWKNDAPRCSFPKGGH